MASRGRIGLAGAGARRPAPGAEAQTSTGKEGQQEGAQREGDKQDEGDDIPVFKGFGSRTHGHIPIPMQQQLEGGDAPPKAMMADEVEAAGRKAREEKEGAAEPGEAHGEAEKP